MPHVIHFTGDMIYVPMAKNFHAVPLYCEKAAPHHKKSKHVTKCYSWPWACTDSLK